MNYLKWKINKMKKTSAFSGWKVKTNLTNLTFEGKKTVGDGEAYTCTLIPITGKYLPQIIEITGTTSAYAFYYDYTTGVIYIPSGEIYGDITITAVASDVNNNVDAILEVATTTATTYDGVTEYTDENFIMMDIYPCRGSTVKVTYGGVTKEITGDISTERYDSIAKQVFFGTYLGQSDGTTDTSGKLTISGAYEAYGIGEYQTKTKIAVEGGSDITRKHYGHITSIVNWGAMKRYIPSYAFYNCKLFTDLTLIDTIRKIGSYAFYYTNNPSGSNYYRKFTLNKQPLYIGTDAFYSTNYNAISYSHDIYINDDNWNWDIWANHASTETTHRHSEATNAGTDTRSVYINGIRTDLITTDIELKDCSVISDKAFYNFRSISTITIPSTVTRINLAAFSYFGKDSGGNYDDELETTVLEKTLIMKGATPPILDAQQVEANGYYVSIKSVIVPKGCVETYKSADGWSDYADYIVEES